MLVDGRGALPAGGGRGVLLAGGGLVAALLVASAIAPTKVIVSVGVGVLLCGGAAALAAGVALPAALLLLGPRAAWTLPVPGFLAAAGARLAFVPRFVSKNALTIAPIATAVYPVASSDRNGQPDIGQLPPGNKSAAQSGSRRRGRLASTVSRALPPRRRRRGSRGASSLESERLSVGQRPRSLSTQTKPLGKLPGALNESGKLLTGGKRELGKLLAGLGLAGAGAQQLREGLGSAASGAAQLHSGSGSAQSGAQQLHDGLATARSGSAMLQAGLGEALTGAKALQNGATQALAGSVELFDGVSSVAEPVHWSLPSTEQLKSLTAQTSGAIGAAKGQADSAGSELARSTQALEAMTSGRSDPRLRGSARSAARRLRRRRGRPSGLGDAQGSAALPKEERWSSEAVLAARRALRGGAQPLLVELGDLRGALPHAAPPPSAAAWGGHPHRHGLTAPRLRET